METSIVLVAWQIRLQYLHGDSSVVCCKPSLCLRRGCQQVPAVLLSLKTVNSSLFVEYVIHKIRLVLWCLIWLIIVISYEENPGETLKLQQVNGIACAAAPGVVIAHHHLLPLVRAAEDVVLGNVGHDSACFTTLYHTFLKKYISCYIDSNCPCKPRTQFLPWGRVLWEGET